MAAIKQVRKAKEQFELFQKVAGRQSGGQFAKQRSSLSRVKYIPIGRENEPWFCDLTTFWEI